MKGVEGRAIVVFEVPKACRSTNGRKIVECDTLGSIQRCATRRHEIVCADNSAPEGLPPRKVAKVACVEVRDEDLGGSTGRWKRLKLGHIGCRRRRVGRERRGPRCGIRVSGTVKGQVTLERGRPPERIEHTAAANGVDSGSVRRSTHRSSLESVVDTYKGGEEVKVCLKRSLFPEEQTYKGHALRLRMRRRGSFPEPTCEASHGDWRCSHCQPATGVGRPPANPPIQEATRAV
mmetsp:Transcript_16735/g.49964  ORF Transcript_16735/g.49964 Transcript_16735/m.49964 type:complete len:234 (+) Transcript_16735:404-1105(+)